MKYLLAILLLVGTVKAQDTCSVDTNALTVSRGRWTQDLLNATAASRLTAFQPVTYKVGIFLVDFPGHRAADSVSLTTTDLDSIYFAYDWRNKTKYNGGTYWESFAQYWREVSRGKLTITGKVVNSVAVGNIYNWIHLDSLAHYTTNTGNIDPRMLANIVHYADSAGWLDTTYTHFAIVPTYRVFNSTGSNTTFIYNGKMYPGWLVSHVNVDDMTSLSVFTHESAHSMFGWGHVPNSARGFSLMEAGAYAPRGWNIPAGVDPIQLVSSGLVNPTYLTNTNTGIDARYIFSNPTIYVYPPLSGTLAERFVAHDSTAYIFFQVAGDSGIDYGNAQPASPDTGHSLFWSSRLGNEDVLLERLNPHVSLGSSFWPYIGHKQSYSRTTSPASYVNLKLLGIQNAMVTPRGTRIDTVVVYPVATTGTASSIGATTATLGGTIASTANTIPVFRMGTTSGVYTHCAIASPGIVNGYSPVSVLAESLTLGTRYFYRLDGIAGNDTVRGSEKSFVTLSTLAPYARSDSSNFYWYNVQRIYGHFSANGVSNTRAYFLWGLTSTTVTDTVGGVGYYVGESSGTDTIGVYTSFSFSQPSETILYWRTLAINPFGGPALGSVKSFVTQAPPGAGLPFGMVNDTVSVGYTTASLSLTVTPSFYSTSDTFLVYRPGAAAGDTLRLAGSPSPVNCSFGSTCSPSTCTRSVTGLSEGTFYYYTGKFKNAAGVAYASNIRSFTTKMHSVAPDVKPIHITASTTTNEASFVDTVIAGNLLTTVSFQYKVSTSPSWITRIAAESPINGGAVRTTYLATSLNYGRKYYGRAIAVNSMGADTSNIDSVNIIPTVPYVVTKNVSLIDTVRATFGGTFTLYDDPGKIGFEYRDSSTSTWTRDTLASVTNHFTWDSSKVYTGLSASTRYYVRAWGVNTVSTTLTYGATVSFRTAALSIPITPPVFTADTAIVTSTTAIMYGTGTTYGKKSSVYFQWGLKNLAGTVTGVDSVNGMGISISLPVTDLIPNTEYEFFIFGSNVDGEGSSAVKYFRTHPADPTSRVLLSGERK